MCLGISVLAADSLLFLALCLTGPRPLLVYMAASNVLLSVSSRLYACVTNDYVVELDHAYEQIAITFLHSLIVTDSSHSVLYRAEKVGKPAVILSRAGLT